MSRIHRISTLHSLAGVPIREPGGVLVAATHLSGAKALDLELLGEGVAWEWTGRIPGTVPSPDYVRSLRRLIASSVGGVVGLKRYGIVRLGELAEAQGEIPILHTLTSESLAGTDPGELADALSQMGTRLLVLEGAVPQMDEMARAVVEAGGPATLRVRARERPYSARSYFRKLYGDLAQGVPLPLAARPTRNQEERLETELFLGEGGDALLAEARLAPEFRLDVPGLMRKTAPPPGDRGEVWPGWRQRGAADGLTASHAGEAAGSDAGSHPGEAAARGAPRVLNANFRDAGGRALDPDEALAAAAEYDLMVDVGPRWTTMKSLVRGNARFPAEALPPTDDGWVVQVTLISGDFEPGTASGEIFVPAGGGQSRPVIGGRRGNPGPLALRVRAPAASDARPLPFEATARLCLHYENNLLQSADVRAGVRAGAGERLERENEIGVDFVLTGTFSDVRRFATRAVRLGSETAGEHPVALGIALNGDGAGGHRIIRKDAPGLPPAWVPFDPAFGTEALRAARRCLLDCFFLKDETTWKVSEDGEGNRRQGLNERNARAKRQFQMDLYHLALVGDTLLNALAPEFRARGMSAHEWLWGVKRAPGRGVIQVARTGSAGYVLPWALMYQYPLDLTDPKQARFCPILEKWSDSGRWEGAEPPPAACPHEADPEWDHYAQGNVICPYGFWGLRYIVEQPLSPLRDEDEEAPIPADATDRVRCGPDVNMAVAVTHDLGNEGIGFRNAHIERIASLPRVSYQPPPADDWTKLKARLAAPEIVYLLCHGKYDEEGKEYLGLGARDEGDHRIYPKNLTAWLQKQPGAWFKTRPLVFINGCHTFEVEPARMLNFVSSFYFGGASGMLGTEISVQLPLALEVGAFMLEKLVDGVTLGDALFDLRWELVRKGNLLGLAYTMYSLADLHVVFDAG